ncbi:MAG: ABC transporter permease [Verrucomicrobiota bacterium]
MFSDVRFALRQLAKSPGFTVVALLTLSVGIGATTVVFSAIDAFLFKPLPHLSVPEDRLVYAAQVDHLRGEDDRRWSYPDFLAVRERTTAFESSWVHTDRTVIISGGSERPQRYIGTEISWDAFEQLGVKPLRGRTFAAADAAEKAAPVVLINATLWQRRFAQSEEALNSTIVLNGIAHTIVGIMPEGWRYPDRTQLWTPLRPFGEKFTANAPLFSARAKLKPGSTLAAAQSEVDAVMVALAKQSPSTHANVGARLLPLRLETIQGTQRFGSLLLGAVLFVLLIACLNVANLLLARSANRSRENAIRLALGAPRGRIVRQLVIESIVLALLGGVGGLILGLWGNDAMVASFPIDIPYWLRFDFDLRVFAFVFVLSLVVALVFGLVPALRVSRPDIVNELKEGGRTAELTGPAAARLRNLLVVVEIALALVLLVGAGLMMRSFLALRQTDPGYDARNVLTFRTGFPHMMYKGENEMPHAFFAGLLPRLLALPGVESAALVSWRPGFTDGAWALHSAIIDSEPLPERMADARRLQLNTVTPGYFATLRIPLLAGRDFDSRIDRMDTKRSVIIDEAFATQYFGSPSAALGRRLTTLEGKLHVEGSASAEIVGVVGTVRHQLDRPDRQSTIYLSVAQNPDATFLTALLRTRGDPLSFVEPAREAVLSVNREIPIYDESALDDRLLRAESVWQLRFFSYLFTVFGLVALFLACIGIYGVMSYNVTQRFQELGVRLALGAEPREIIGLVLRHGARLVGFGLVAGLISAFLLTHLLTGLLYGISPRDPPTFAVVPFLLALVALAACWLSSRRATLIDPNAALRVE